MYSCPRCHESLTQNATPYGVFWQCNACHGQAMGFGVLRKTIGERQMAGLWRKAVTSTNREGCSCPMCSHSMTTIQADVNEQSITLDTCQPCGFVWFDAGEYESIPPAPARPHVLDTIDQTKLTPEMRRKLARAQVQDLGEKYRAQDPTPDEDWKSIPALFGMPVELDTVLHERVPWATYLLAAVITAISLASFYDLDRYVMMYGLIPDQAWRDHGLTLLTSFFLHGGFLHLFSNLYFLLVFGRAVEKDLGPLRWLLLVFTADQIGNLLDIWGDPRGDLPSIGASGGISGLIAYYGLKFPRARLGILFGFAWIQFPAWVAFVFWVLLQCYGAWSQHAGLGDVSSLAHLGGLIPGVIFWWIYRNNQIAMAAETSGNPLNIKIK